MEEHDFHMLAQKHYPDERPRGEGMLDNEGHWHEHMI
jgi:hypothetical protein